LYFHRPACLKELGPTDSSYEPITLHDSPPRNEASVNIDPSKSTPLTGLAGRRLGVTSFFAASAFVAICFLGSPAAAESISNTAAMPSDPCAQAQALVKDQPEQAIKLIEAYRKPAIDLLSAGEIDTADPALAESLRNQATDCELQWQAALVAANPAASPPKPPAKFAGAWESFVKVWINPLVVPGGAVLAVFLGLLILGRLLVLVPGSPWTTMSRKKGQFSLVSGGVISLVSATSIVALAGWEKLANSSALSTSLPVLLSIGILVGLAAALLVAIGLAGRMRLSIQFSTKDGSSNTAGVDQTIAYLVDIGATSPDNFHLPPAADADGIKGIVPDLGGGKIIGTLIATLQNIFGLVPWRASIAQLDDTRSAVIVRRNGRTAMATVVSLGQWPQLSAPPKPPKLTPSARIHNSRAVDPPAGPSAETLSRYTHRMATAVILATIARSYNDFTSLYGATDSASIGLYFLAKTEFATDDERASALLSAALQADPNNYLAQFAFANLQYRESTTESALIEFADLLAEQLKQEENLQLATGPSQQARLDLRLRVLLVHSFAVRNLVALSASPTEASRVNEALTAGIHSAHEAAKLLEPNRQGLLYDKLRMATALTVKILAHQWRTLTKDKCKETQTETALAEALKSTDKAFEKAAASWSPDIAYSMACYWAVTGDSHPSVPEKIRIFRLALRSSIDREWVKKDPELSKARKQKWFTEALREQNG